MMDQEKHNNQDHTNFYSQQDEEYGLPVAEYSPLEHEQSNEQPLVDYNDVEEEPVRPSKREIPVKEKEERSTWPIWVGLLVLLIAGGGATYYFMYSEPEPVVMPVVTKQPEPEPIVEEAPAPVQEWTPPVEKQEGSVTAISSKTGRYYVIIGSFIDGDMASDYAQKLASQGTPVSLLEPIGDRKFYRLGVKDAATFDEANAELDNLKNTFGQDIWVIRY